MYCICTTHSPPHHAHSPPSLTLIHIILSSPLPLLSGFPGGRRKGSVWLVGSVLVCSTAVYQSRRPDTTRPDLVLFCLYQRAFSSLLLLLRALFFFPVLFCIYTPFSATTYLHTTPHYLIYLPWVHGCFVGEQVVVMRQGWVVMVIWAFARIFIATVWCAFCCAHAHVTFAFLPLHALLLPAPHRFRLFCHCHAHFTCHSGAFCYF